MQWIQVSGAPADDAVEAQEKRVRWIDIASAVILSICTLATAWSGYQAARWSGVQSVRFSEASAMRIASTHQSSVGFQLAQVDIATFTSYLNAVGEGDVELAAFHERRFRPDFLPAFQAWMALDPFNNPDAPPGPFQMDDYRLPEFAESDRLSAQSEAIFNEGKTANQTSDNYVLTTVVLAAVLFFVGISSRLGSPGIRAALVGFGALILFASVVTLATFPIE